MVALLPTVLRPPQQPPTQSAELSPDAPPDEAKESIIAALKRAQSVTAGATPVDGPPEELPAVAPIVRKPGRGRCSRGTPPRQVPSLYATACAPAFTGDNGGATSFGVTRDTVNITVSLLDTDSSAEGPVDPEQEGETVTRRTLRGWQEYFNRNFEFSGRRLRFFINHQSFGQSPAEGAAAAQQAKHEFKSFGLIDGLITNYGMQLESIRLGMVTMIGFNSAQFYRDHDPYAFGWLPDTDKTIAATVELICKQFAGRPPFFNKKKDASFDYSAPRKFGVIYYEDGVHTTERQTMKDSLARQCGLKDLPEATYNLSDNIGSAASGVMTRMRANGVTTVVYMGEHFSPAIFGAEAEAQGYHPEWIHAGTGGVDTNSAAHDNGAQWAHVVGISYLEIERPRQYGEDLRQYNDVDPDRDPDRGLSYVHSQLFMLANGIQGAGPRLTPESFRDGLFKKMPSRAPDPVWSMGGGFGPNDYTYPDWFALQWWDPEAVAPSEENEIGAYRYLLDGERFQVGQIPTEPLGWQTEGITTPADPRPPDD